MGVSVSEGTIAEWRKQPGDWVAYEEPICLISTDKIDTDVPSPAAGRVQEVLVEVGTTVEVGTVLARIATDAKPGEAHVSEGGQGAGDATTNEEVGTGSEAAAAVGDTPAQASRGAAPEPGAVVDAGHREAAEAAKSLDVPKPAGKGARRYSPVVSRIAAEHGIDLDQVEGTGRGGRVRKQDVLAFLENGGGAQAAGGEEPPLHIESPYRPDPEPEPAKFEPKPAAAAAPAAAPYQPPAAQPLSRMRAQIGHHMKRSLDTAATCTTWIEVDMSRIESVRKAARLTALPYVARCTIDALREFPTLNAWLDGEQITVHEEINLGIAVSLGGEGLIVPVIQSAQDLAPEGLGKRIRDLARRARDRRLTPDDVQGGTFTITNPGQYGSVMATPVINQPQVAILDLEAVVKRPVVVTAADGSDSIAIRPMCIFGLAWDHRALDGALAAQFLAEIKRRVESWD
jgi:2-oxoglutarate dehydrogenase E2 component (dihydrolipoamide succinyltransferase)